MAITVATGDGVTKGRGNDVWGARRVSLFKVTLDDSYPTGGEAFDPKQFGHVGKTGTVLIFPRYSSGATGSIDTTFLYDYTNKKIVAVVGNTGAEVANGTDKSTVVLDIIVLSD